MTIMGIEGRQTLARMLLALFVTVSLMLTALAPADAAPRAKCRNHPENFSFFHGKCLSDKKIERLTGGE